MSKEIREEEQENIQKIEDDEIELEKGIVDDLYVLKCSLVKEGKPTREAGAYLEEIQKLVADYPLLCTEVSKWKFLEGELLYFLRSSKFDVGLKIAISVISATGKAPALYFTKKFLFFITEKLYIALGGCHENVKILDNIVEQYSDNQQDKMEVFGVYDNLLFTEPKINPTCRLIFTFIRALIQVNKSIIDVLNDLKLFELANACVCIESAQLFNEVFKEVVYSDSPIPEKAHQPWTQDGIYEIRRPHFEPEVVFREKSIFKLKTPVENLKNGIYKKIYDQCTNIKEFADISLNDVYDILLYKKMVYMCDELELQILEGKKPKALRIYRRSLEQGAVSDRAYLNAIIKAIDEQETSRDAVIILYYFREHMIDPKPYTEKRVRAIMKTLEYSCNHECIFIEEPEVDIKPKVERAIKSSIGGSFDSNQFTNEIFGNTCDKGVFSTPSDIENISNKQNRTVLEDFSEFGKEDREEKEQEKNELERCERYRILKVIEHIYERTDRRYFLKPSYLILFKSLYDHVPSERMFLTEYFKDFLAFLRLETKNIARVLIPVNTKTKKPKMKEIRMEDEIPIGNIQDEIYQEDNFNEKRSNNKIRIKGNMIESSEE